MPVSALSRARQRWALGFWTSATLLIAAALCGGCSSVPKVALTNYVADFNTTQQTAQDMILGAKNAAQEVADAPQRPGNISERTQALAERLAALDARLAALEVVAQYNDALVKLSEGDDPAQVSASLSALGTSLASFRVKWLTKLVKDVGPYGAVIAGAVELIDQQIKAHQFREAVASGERPVTAILQVLIDDADQLQLIDDERIALRIDPLSERAIDLGMRFQQVAGQGRLSGADADQLARLLARHNALRRNISAGRTPLPELTLPATAPTGGDPAGSFDAKTRLEMLASLVDQVAQVQREYSALQDQLKARRDLTAQYKSTLQGTQAALHTVRVANDASRGQATLQFAVDAYRLRQAFLKVREAETK